MLKPNNPVESFVSPEQLERYEKASALLRNIKKYLPELEALLASWEDHWGIEDGIYRFYHQSFKVYHLQQSTVEICAALRRLLPDEPMNPWFSEIICQGTKQEFDLSHNQDWPQHTRPIVEAAFHAHHLLKMAVKYGQELDAAPDCLPSGWATVLYLYGLR